MRLETSTLRRLWPQASSVLVAGIAARSERVFARYGLTSPLRVAHFMAQISHECGGGTIVRENLDYSHPARIAAVWPRRFTPASAAPYVHNPRALADVTYNGRMGNRPNSDDGFNYRGGGPLQLTGADNYRAIGAICGLPLYDRPDLVGLPTTALEVAAAEFQHLGCLPWCDADNVEAVTRRVNGGYTGLAQRRDWLTHWRAALAEDAARGAPETVPAPVPAPAQTPVPLPQPRPDVAPDPRPLQPETLPIPNNDLDPPSAPAPLPDLPSLPPVPRGSDEVLPPGVDRPGKGMEASPTGWAALVAMFSGAAATVGQLVDTVRPILADPHVLVALLIAGAGAALFIYLRHRNELKVNRV